MIQSFATKETAAIFAGVAVKRMPREILIRAKARLDQLHAAVVVEDMRLPPSNRLEKLSGGREGQWSVRINAQWRICFQFEGGHAFDVEIVDYH